MTDLDHCPRCDRRITDVDPEGFEAPTGQRWCLVHRPCGCHRPAEHPDAFPSQATIDELDEQFRRLGPW